MLRSDRGLTEEMARSLTEQIACETSGQVQIVEVFPVTAGKYWRLRVQLRGRELVQVIESPEGWRSVRDAWNELVPRLVPAHTHRWVRLPRSVGLFRCVVCEERGVCPGCLNSLQVGLAARDAGFSVLWCREHTPVPVGAAHEA